MDIIQALYSGNYPLNGTQYKIILYILDNTDMGEKIGAELPLKEISRDIKAHDKQISRELKKLFDYNIVKIIEDYSRQDRYGRVLAINPPNVWLQQQTCHTCHEHIC